MESCSGYLASVNLYGIKQGKRYSMIENNPCQDAQKPKRKDEDEGLKFFTPKQALMFMKSLDMSYEVTYKGHQRIDDTGKPYYGKFA